MLLKHLSIFELWFKSLYYLCNYLSHFKDFLSLRVKDIDRVLALGISQLYLQWRREPYSSNTYVFLELLLLTPSPWRVMFLRGHLSSISLCFLYHIAATIKSCLLVVDSVFTYGVVESESFTAFSMWLRYRVFYWRVNIVHSLDIIIIWSNSISQANS